MNKAVELEAAEALLDIGVSVPLKTFRLLFCKKRFMFRLTMKRPCLWNMIKIASLYLEMNITHNQMKDFTKDEEMAFIALHGKRVSQMVALTFCRDGIFSSFLYKPLAWFLRRTVQDIFLQGAFMHFVSLMGAKSFIRIINSVEIANPMQPKLSQKKKGS